MVGGGEGAFIGAVHRIAACLDDRYTLVAGALSSTPERAARSAEALGIARSYPDFASMAREEARVGQRTTLDVLNAQQTLLNARVQLVGAQRDRVVATYAILASCGAAVGGGPEPPAPALQPDRPLRAGQGQVVRVAHARRPLTAPRKPSCALVHGTSPGVACLRTRLDVLVKDRFTPQSVPAPRTCIETP